MVKEESTAIIWLNYNSSKFFNIVKLSLDGIRDLDYDNFVLIAVDNGSMDDSYVRIREYLEKTRIRSKFIRLTRNLGFTGGNNIAWNYVLRNGFKYVVFLNNDFIVEQNSLRRIVETLSQYEKAIAAQGIIELRFTRLIDNYGFYASELLVAYPFMFLKPISNPKKCYRVSYVSGAYAIYKVDQLKEILSKTGIRYPFITEAFGYFDDNFLGFLGWSYGYESLAIPVYAGKHMRGLTFKHTGVGLYVWARSHGIKVSLLRSRFRNMFWLWILKRGFIGLLKTLALRDDTDSQFYIKGLVKGLGVGKKIYLRNNLCIDMSKVPLIKENIFSLLRKYILERGTIEKSLEKIMRYGGFNC